MNEFKNIVNKIDYKYSVDTGHRPIPYIRDHFVTLLPLFRIMDTQLPLPFAFTYSLIDYVAWIELETLHSSLNLKEEFKILF